MNRILKLILLIVLTNGCSDSINFQLEKSAESCKLSFVVASGVFEPKKIAAFNIVSSLQLLDHPAVKQVYIGEPSTILLEPGSVQKIEIENKFLTPEFHKNYLQPEYQYWGPAFTFDENQSGEIYRALQAGAKIRIHGRLEVGQQYTTTIADSTFEDTDQSYTACINRLLNQQELHQMEIARQS